MITKYDMTQMIKKDLAAYRAFRKQLEADHDAVEQAVADHYETNETPEQTVARLIGMIGYDRTVGMIATLVNSIGTWDERISERNRSWAKTVENALDQETARDCYIYQRMHSCHVDQIANYARRAERPVEPDPEQEEQTETEQPVNAEILRSEPETNVSEASETSEKAETPVENEETKETAEDAAEGHLKAETTESDALPGRPSNVTETAYQKHYKARKAVNHKKARWNRESFRKIVEAIREQSELMTAMVAEGQEMHVKFSPGNIKTGAIMSVSLTPGATCASCCRETCGKDCYAFGCCNRTNVRNAWAWNTVYALRFPADFWAEVAAVSGLQKWFRYHVGGDIPNREYFEHMVETARRNPGTTYLCFTKRFEIVNRYVSEHGGSRETAIPSNLRILFSAWKNAPAVNPYRFPETVGYGEEGPAEDWLLCGGNCSECCCRGTGCWKAETGETIAFKIH